MGEYLAAPRATTTPFMPVVVALVGGTAKTVLQVATPSTTDILVLAWSVSFDGASGYNASVEGTMTTVVGLDAQHVHPQAGYGVWFPEGSRRRVGPSRFLRIRCQAPAGVNVIPCLWWAEPSV